VKQQKTARRAKPVTRTPSPPPIDESELRALVEGPQRVYWWGREHDISPRVIGKVFGDGRRLITVWPLTTRPNYFVVRVDSAEEFEIRDTLDDLGDAAEEEFGRFRRDEEEDEDAEDTREFPICDWDFGVCWGDRYTIEELRSDHQESAAVQP
jgi:hypothetical protein